MPQQTSISVAQGFSKGMMTEFTGLNFPDDVVLDTRNCIFNRIGNVTRRPGIDFEANNHNVVMDRTNLSINTYKWNNVSGDGLTQLLVVQIGTILYFYKSNLATISNPLSSQISASTVDLTNFSVFGSSNTIASEECQFSDGNGYLFVYHPYIVPFYCSYSGGVVSSFPITVSIRDFTGLPETGISDTFRPNTLTTTHQYNLQNQGWTNAPGWTASSTTSNNCATGVKTWTIDMGLTIIGGSLVSVTTPGGRGFVIKEVGTVASYNSGTGVLVLNITSSNSDPTFISTSWTFEASNTSNITTWQSANSNYPSNSDVWWLFKNTSGIFDPATTTANITLNSGPSPKGYYILEAFTQDRTSVSGVSSILAVDTFFRPKTGTWFQGRVWYTGVDDANFTENIYFSQIIETTDQFGKCYQINDPTSEDRFDLLPSDGGVIHIQGCGSIYKLFPIQNGMLVFTANGIWFITGSQGIGFTANDYTITKISNIQSISSTSFVNVQGYPIWWNEEGIYAVANSKAGLQVQPLTFTTIQTFYQAIPLSSKKRVRGDYDPLDWVVRWVYKNTEESSITDRYQFDSLLVLNTATNAFYPWSLSTTTGIPYINGINYVQSPGGSNAADPIIKYLVSYPSDATYGFTFAEERDLTYVDWNTSGRRYNYISDFITGYRIKGQAQHRFQLNYFYVYLNNYSNMGYIVQGIWDFANSGNAGRWSTAERTTTRSPLFNVVTKRHRIRGRGLALQLKFTSIDGMPFDIIGWSAEEKVNTGI